MSGVCTSAKAVVAREYWDVSRSLHCKEVAPRSARQSIEFLCQYAAQDKWWTMRIRAGSLLASKFPALVLIK